MLRFFDQIRFYPVSEQELLEFREAFPRGRVKLRIEPTTFRLADYQAFLAEHKESIAAFKARQQAAFEEERERWALLPQAEEKEPVAEAGGSGELELLPGEVAVRSQVAGSVWQVVVNPGDRVRAGDKVVILETMKMETVCLGAGRRRDRQGGVQAGHAGQRGHAAGRDRGGRGRLTPFGT